MASVVLAAETLGSRQQRRCCPSSPLPHPLLGCCPRDRATLVRRPGQAEAEKPGSMEESKPGHSSPGARDLPKLGGLAPASSVSLAFETRGQGLCTEPGASTEL